MDKKEIIELLKAEGEKRTALYKTSREKKLSILGDKVYFRGLVEFSNRCSKDCFYCGIRKSNRQVMRYDVSEQDIMNACRFAYEKKFGSVVLQSGEIASKLFIKRVDSLLKKIKQLSNNELGITLSCGEQTPETYRRWFESGAHRYLLRVESSNQSLYEKIHPVNNHHSYKTRLNSLHDLKAIGYQVGTGVMIGLPFQTLDDLAEDLLLFKQLDIDMCGMGPYVEHEKTPLFKYRNTLMSKQDRFDLTLNMVAVLRLLMPDINISAVTALQAIHPEGREMALSIGANIIMPNLTPALYRKEYKLYENKPFMDEDAEETLMKLENRIRKSGFDIGYGEWGDSIHFKKKKTILL